MQLLTFYDRDGRLRLGARHQSGVVDVAAAAAALQLPGSELDPGQLFTFGHAGVARIAEILAGTSDRTDLIRDEVALTLGPCVPAPGKIIGVGLNYRRHAVEARMALPESPVLFAKYANAIAGPGSPIVLPPEALQYDYEVELAVVIGQRAARVSEGEARSRVLGYATANDLSARDLQFRTGQWLLGKTLDGFLPIGPYLVTADEVPDPQLLQLRSWVNGEPRQDASTADMVFSVDQLVSYISHHMTLESGDVILTGTPEGVIAGRASPVWLRAGDVVEVEVQGLGRLGNRMVALAGS
jgi:2-keto-4-pentenoate hydratase/2-oxohepta-3-ene-1,7-dioic acid hydratase in catechol pathway